MKRVLLTVLTLSLAACLPAEPLPPTLPSASATVDPKNTQAETPSSTDSGEEESPADSQLSNATIFPDADNYKWEKVVSGLKRPVDLQHAGDERLFIIEKRGAIHVLQDGNLAKTPFMDISDRINSRGNEQGLLGLAFHPDHAENGFFFVNYTDKDGDTVISRFSVTADPNIANPSSEVVLLRVIQPFGNHNGGVLAFGPDGFLYAGLGDGGSAGDPQDNGQKLDTFLGKILRLDVDTAEPYAIPADNPFGNEIWAYGLRNPWRMSFDSLSGDLYIGDVGQGDWEEINFVPAGVPGGINFGWKYFEGTHNYSGTPPQGAQFTAPVSEYSHAEGCSVTGGYVYRGIMAEWYGIYLYGDYCSGDVRGLIFSDGTWQDQVLFHRQGDITSFGQDSSGEVYLVTDGGFLLRLTSR